MCTQFPALLPCVMPALYYRFEHFPRPQQCFLVFIFIRSSHPIQACANHAVKIFFYLRHGRTLMGHFLHVSGSFFTLKIKQLLCDGTSNSFYCFIEDFSMDLFSVCDNLTQVRCQDDAFSMALFTFFLLFLLSFSSFVYSSRFALPSSFRRGRMITLLCGNERNHSCVKFKLEVFSWLKLMKNINESRLKFVQRTRKNFIVNIWQTLRHISEVLVIMKLWF